MRFAPQTIPASDAGLFCAAGRREASGLEPFEFESRGTVGWLPGGTTISTISRWRLLYNAG